VIEYGPIIKGELMASLLGKELGAGIARAAFVSDLDETIVIKVENSKGSFQNVIEWETWKRFKDDKSVARWLAPCVWISQSGGILMMKRTMPLLRDPKQMPRFLCDFKRSNYGLLNGRVVCHDYGTNLLMRYGDKPVMRNVEWWD
jgi:hypothetical protein